MNALWADHLAWQDRAPGGLKALETFKTMDLPALSGWRVGNNGSNRCLGTKKRLPKEADHNPVGNFLITTGLSTEDRRLAQLSPFGSPGNRAVCTDFGSTQVLVPLEENRLVHTKRPPLLLLLICIKAIEMRSGNRKAKKNRLDRRF
jgi:hypothetical protein